LSGVSFLNLNLNQNRTNRGTLFAVTVVTYVTKNNKVYIFYSNNQSSISISNVAGSLDSLISVPCGKEHFWYPKSPDLWVSLVFFQR